MKYFIHFAVALTVCFSTALASAQNKVVVVPLDGAVGDAVPSDVVKGKTFSSKAAGKGATGTLEQHPMGQSYTNSIGMTFNLIPAGTFIMGSPANEPGRDPDETQHQVTLSKPFYMQTTEVTNKQWNALVVDTGLGENPSLSHTGDEYPVDNVNWYEAAGFANLLSLAEGLTICYPGNNCTGTPGDNFTCESVTINPNCTGYRLPTEAQWEYAARAGTTTAYANPYSFDATNTETGSGFNSNLAAMGWYSWNRTTGGYADGTKHVAQQQANYWGLYDMHGNVSEWCQDWWDGTAYSPDPVTDPQGDASGTYRVLRGGFWDNIARFSRSASRFYDSPGFRHDNLGFRLALPPVQ